MEWQRVFVWIFFGINRWTFSRPERRFKRAPCTSSINYRHDHSIAACNLIGCEVCHLLKAGARCIGGMSVEIMFDFDCPLI